MSEEEIQFNAYWNENQPLMRVTDASTPTLTLSQAKAIRAEIEKAYKAGWKDCRVVQ